MKGASLFSSALALCLGSNIVAAAPKDTQQPGFDKGQPYDGKGKGAVLLGKLPHVLVSNSHHILTQ